MVLTLSIDILHHFQIEARQALHLLGRRQHAHSRHAEIAQEGHGVIVILRPDETPRDLMDAVQSIGLDRATPPAEAGAKVLRTYGIGAQILRDLGVTRMRVLSAPKQMQGLSGFDLEVVEYVDG